MADTDPFMWSPDQVKFQICSLDSYLRSSLQIKPILNLQALAATLADNDIDGENLLALEDLNVKEDLGISSFGQRRELRKIIHHLRSVSLLYLSTTRQSHKRRHSSEEAESESTPSSKKRRMQPQNLTSLPQPEITAPALDPVVEPLTHPTESAKRRIQPQNLSSEPLTKWINDQAHLPDLAAATSKTINHPADFNPADLSDEWQDFLQRYREGSEESVLRPYNESDLEKELDSEDDASLLAELQAEDIPNVPHLAGEDIERAIEEALEEYKQSWKTHKQPKKHKVAHRRWMQAAKARTRKPQQNALQGELSALRDRLAKFRGSIAHPSMDYHKIGEVKRNCLNLQATVEDITEKEYYLEVLTSEHPPPRPETSPQPPVQEEKLSEGEELLDSSDSVDEQETDGSSEDVNGTAITSDDESTLSLLYDPADDEWNPRLPSEPTSPIIVPEGIANLDAHIEVTDLSEPMLYSDLPEATPPSTQLVSLPSEADMSSTLQGIKVPSLSSSTHSVVSAESNEEDQEDSDLDILPKNRYRDEGNTRDTAISLGSSPARISDDHTDTSVKTPPLNPTPATKIKYEKSDIIRFPSIQELRAKRWREVKGNAYLSLCKAVYHTVRTDSSAVLQFVETFTGADVLDRLRAGLSTIQDTEEVDIPSIDAGSDPLIYLTYFFVIYAHERGFREVWDVAEAFLDKAFDMIPTKALMFDKLLRPLLRFYTQTGTSLADQIDFPKLRNSERLTNDRGGFAEALLSCKGKQSAVRSKKSTPSVQNLYSDTETDPDEVPSSLKKRKRHVEQDQEALSQQRDDRHRVQEQETRRQIMMDKLHSQEATGEDHNVIINSVVEVPILLHQHIARRIKPHQESGVQFIWRELIEDKKHQGCLLAHTMGLGKTMQVVSFLVTLAQCNASDRPEVQALIPKKLRSGRVLILCPASLVDNWFDELMMWTPPKASTSAGRGLLGTVYKISGGRNFKIKTIKDWQRQAPGVLIIGYESLRSLLTSNKVSDDDKKFLENALLHDPCVVVGDEAHKMKNAKSSISKLAQTFQTKSRIALTGSPLNNHLEEYHTMIHWIAPGYLGDIVQFRSRYSEAIERGLFAESSRYEKRKSLERLYVLKRDLAPKIDRRDISAIAKDMPQKTEFFITVPLTELQRSMYSLLVRQILSGLKNGSGTSRKSSNAQLWSWLAILSWLCNHPTVLTQKLQDKDKNNAQANINAGVDNEDYDEDGVPADDGAPANVDMNQSPIAALLPSFMEQYTKFDVASDIYNPNLSVRALVTRLLIQESVNRGERILLFSHSIPTLNYLQGMLDSLQYKYMRIDGSTRTDQRQAATKEFNDDKNDYMVFLISTRAGGLGLNLQGANRVIIYDFGFNPSWEEQAIGRAYRLGQKKPVFVYRFRAGGSFEDAMYNKSIFKTQLFSRVVDQKNVIRHTSRDIKDYLFEPKDVEQRDLSESLGKDELLDKVIEMAPGAICDLILTETFQREDEDDELTVEEKKLADAEVELARLERANPAEYVIKKAAMERAQRVLQIPQAATQSPYPFASQLHGGTVHDWFKNAAENSEVVMRDAVRANEEKMGVDIEKVVEAMTPSSGDGSEGQSKPPGCDPQ